MTTMVTPGITAFWESVIVPEMLPVVPCAATIVGVSRTARNVHSRAIVVFICPSPRRAIGTTIDGGHSVQQAFVRVKRRKLPLAQRSGQWLFGVVGEQEVEPVFLVVWLEADLRGNSGRERCT